MVFDTFSYKSRSAYPSLCVKFNFTHSDGYADPDLRVKNIKNYQNTMSTWVESWDHLSQACPTPPPMS